MLQRIYRKLDVSTRTELAIVVSGHFASIQPLTALGEFAAHEHSCTGLTTKLLSGHAWTRGARSERGLRR